MKAIIKPSFLLLFTCVTSLCIGNIFAIEPLKSASKELIEQNTNRLITKFDFNKDGKIQKFEDESIYKRNKAFDINKDQSLDLEELKSSFKIDMQSPGRSLLNVIYKKTPQGKLHLDIFFPEDESIEAKPVVFFTHGGGWAAGDKSKAVKASFAKIHRAWLKEGFVVVSVGYRLVNKSRETSMRDCVIDCKDAMRFISAHKETLKIDSNKFYNFGDSAGGHLAMMLLHTDPESLTGDKELSQYTYRTVAGVSWYGPCDFQDIQLFNHDDRPDFNDRFGARIMAKDSRPEDKVSLYEEMSPVSYLNKTSAPLLMIQGDRDSTIPVKQAYRMQEALKSINAPVEIEIVKNAGHNWKSVEKPINPTREEIVQRTINFLVKHKK